MKQFLLLACAFAMMTGSSYAGIGDGDHKKLGIYERVDNCKAGEQKVGNECKVVDHRMDKKSSGTDTEQSN